MECVDYDLHFMGDEIEILYYELIKYTLFLHIKFETKF
jgi:hypothetical protein